MSSKTSAHWRMPLRVAAIAAAVAVTVSCSGPGGEEAPQAAEPVASSPAAVPESGATDRIAAMSVEELKEAASTAYRESRLYAPDGDNAMEYFLALRDRQPGDASVSSALIDLLPMTVIATEQSRDRDDFDEARRLLALITRADPKHPSAERLVDSIAKAEVAVVELVEQQRLSAEQEAERQQRLTREREEQQRRAQEQAARDLQAQQLAAEAEASRQAQARQEAVRQQEAAQERARQEAAARTAAAAAAPRPQQPAAPTLRAISTPPPRFPAEALRTGVSGEVQVEFTVGIDGSVTNARVVRANPPRVFDREAVAAVRRWRFEPVSEPVTSRRTIGFEPGQ